MGTTCPRCGFSEPGSVECPHCGVVFAKFNRPGRPTAPAPVEAFPRRSGPRFTRLDGALLIALTVSGAVIVSRWAQPPVARPGTRAPLGRRATPPPSRAPAAADRDTPPAPLEPWAAPPTEPDLPTPAPPVGSPLLPASSPLEASAELLAEERALAERLERAATSGSELELSHLHQAENLYARHPAVPRARRALELVLEASAQQARAQGRSVDAVRYRERATELWPESPPAWLALIQEYRVNRDWRGAEIAARRALSPCPEHALLHVQLAEALRQQGRDEEAADVLRRLLARREDAGARALLANLEKELGSTRSMARQAGSHFSIRFEGRADDALGRALERMLEDKHALLARTLDFEPDREIPVILYPQQVFRSVSSAPDWAAGTYSHSDGRIRIGTRGLSAGFVPVDLERTLTHELTHAFVDWRTRGLAPDDVNEGLAQYLSGRRLGYRLAASRTVVRDGRMKVDDFYDAALSFVEYLLERYRQSAMNDLLEVIGETGSVDQAFRRSYRQSYDELREEWIAQLP
jgi:tetratricopeptide (TPR) repeat protein